MFREFKLGGLYVLIDSTGAVYPRIFLNKEDAESTNNIICNSKGKIYPAFINS